MHDPRIFLSLLPLESGLAQKASHFPISHPLNSFKKGSGFAVLTRDSMLSGDPLSPDLSGRPAPCVCHRQILRFR